MSENDQAEIRTLIENWVILRDSGDWDRFAALWHQDARMEATWFSGTADEFIEASRAAFDRGAHVSHFLGGSAIEIRGTRAIAQTKMKIEVRAPVEGVLCDITCSGRFYDFLERRQGRWGIVTRQPIYEKDRLDPVDPHVELALDPLRLQSYPEGYRYLAYAQTAQGMTVAKDLPGLRGAALERLIEQGRRFLDNPHAADR